jgi:hypothetical protein
MSRIGSKSQKQRVLEALRDAGATGIAEGAFQGRTIDGGPPIRKFTARINELRNAGYDIDAQRVDGQTSYILVGENGNGNSSVSPLSKAELSRRVREYRKQEKVAGLSARSIAIEHRRRIIELSLTIRRVEPIVFWKSVKDDELEMVFEEVVDLHVWVERLLSSLDSQRGDKKLREKIANLRDTRGRTEIEAEIYRRKAEEEEKKLL